MNEFVPFVDVKYSKMEQSEKKAEGVYSPYTTRAKHYEINTAIRPSEKCFKSRVVIK